MIIHSVKSGLGRFQKGEDKIIKTYRNADEAVKAILE